MPVTNITFDHNRLTLSIGSTATLVAMVSPKETSDKTMVWSSSDESIVQINSATGLMEAVKEGAAIITCTTKQSDLKALCDVVVLPILNILFVGNSFTYDAVRWLPGLLRGAGVKNVNMVLMYRSGSLIKEHVSDYESDIGYTCYRAVPGAPGWVSTTGYSIKDVIDERKWNVVSIQEHTENAEAWGLTPQRQGVI
ncbi:DUF4886 domain-containing protein, partial [Parapedobacter sp. SGR-10]|uniref:Ig-like domain-containing protein n=1 Tax=Parapedobacter sp. SGR-10 TaxID=2710879 RepID=UPI0013D1ACE0